MPDSHAAPSAVVSVVNQSIGRRSGASPPYYSRRVRSIRARASARSENNEKAARRPPFRMKTRSAPLFFVVVVLSTLEDAEADLLRLAAELEDIQPGAIAIRHVDEPAIVDFDVVSHVAVRAGVRVGDRDVEAHLDGSLGLANVPDAHAAGEVREERQPAVKRVPEVF